MPNSTLEEGRSPNPSLASLADQVAARFRLLEFHESGVDMQNLQDATLHVLGEAKLGENDLFAVAMSGASIAPELVQVVIAESKEFNPNHWKFVAGGRLVAEEAKLRHPSLLAEEQDRFRRRGPASIART